MTWRACLLAIAAVTTLLAAPLYPTQAGTDTAPDRVTFPGTDEDRTEITGYIYKPQGAGPSPAIVALHGCSGLFERDGDRLNARHRDWGERLVHEGFVVLFPDSYGSRGLRSVCNQRDREITPRGRVADVRGAVDWLATQPFVDARRLALIGWSNGGSTTLRALDPSAAPAKADFRQAFAFYPGCRPVTERVTWKPRLPLSILIGAADDWTPAAPCAELAKRWGAVYHEFPGAYHDFDAPNTPVYTRENAAFSASGDGTVHVGTDKAARQAAIDIVLKALETLKK